TRSLRSQCTYHRVLLPWRIPSRCTPTPDQVQTLHIAIATTATLSPERTSDAYGTLRTAVLSGAIGTTNMETKMCDKGATPWVGLIEDGYRQRYGKSICEAYTPKARMRSPGKASHCLLAPCSALCIETANTRELQRHVHEQKINPTSTLPLLFKHSSTIHKQFQCLQS